MTVVYIWDYYQTAEMGQNIKCTLVHLGKQTTYYKLQNAILYSLFPGLKGLGSKCVPLFMHLGLPQGTAHTRQCVPPCELSIFISLYYRPALINTGNLCGAGAAPSPHSQCQQLSIHMHISHCAVMSTSAWLLFPKISPAQWIMTTVSCNMRALHTLLQQNQQ